MRTGSANLTRRSVLVVSVTLSLLSVESALDDEVPAPRSSSVTSYRWQTWHSERGPFSVDISVAGSTDEQPDTHRVLASTSDAAQRHGRFRDEARRTCRSQKAGRAF